MVTQQIVTLIDDITGEPAARTVSFSLDGAEYEIDLASAGIIELVSMLNTYIKHARKVPYSRSHSRDRISPDARNAKAVRDDIRAWAKDNNIPVPVRGRIARATIEKYEKAHTN